MITMNPEIVEKECISKLTPVNYEVLTVPEQRRNRMQALLRLWMGGNLYKVKSLIHFHTQQGLKAVNTTVWSVTDKHIALKGGVMIPIHAISHVSP